MKKKMVLAFLLYLLPGIIISAGEIARDLRTFECKKAPSHSSTYYISSEDYVNRNPSRCNRVAFDLHSIRDYVVLLFFGTPQVLLKIGERIYSV